MASDVHLTASPAELQSHCQILALGLTERRFLFLLICFKDILSCNLDDEKGIFDHHFSSNEFLVLYRRQSRCRSIFRLLTRQQPVITPETCISTPQDPPSPSIHPTTKLIVE